MVDNTELRKSKLQRWNALVAERTPWIGRWTEITKYIFPFGGRFTSSDRNDPRASAFNHIYDESAIYALDVLKSGLMAGMTNPSRPWFRIATRDTDLMEYHAVKLWLEQVTEKIRYTFARSNLYRVLPMLYEELGAFGTAVGFILPNRERGIWLTPLTAGEYALAADSMGRVNTIYREFEITVAEFVDEFVHRPDGTMDWSNVSATVKNLWDSAGGRDKTVRVLHVVEPRYHSERDGAKALSQHKPWRSLYLELGAAEGKVLRDSGFDENPGLGVRWSTRGRDVYGVAPAFNALGSVKQLQQQQLRKGQAIDYLARPPVALPGDMKGLELDTLPGGVNYYQSVGAAKPSNLYDVRLDLNALLLDIRDVRERINRAFYVDLFLAVTQDTRNERATAREIAERHEEKLLMLGPVLERLHDELLSPLVDRTFLYLLDAGVLPPPPEELQGTELRVEFVSVLAQAQRAVGLSAMDRLIGTVATLAAQSGDITVWDKIDKDQLIDEYSERLAVDPSVIVADEHVALIRQRRAQQQAAQQQAAQLAAAAKPTADMAKGLRDMQDLPPEVMSAAAAAMRNLTGL